MMKLLSLAVALTGLAAPLAAITGGVRDVEEFTLHSEIVGVDYRILVSLPAQYAEPDGSFPVIYNLDSDITFGMVTDISRMLRLDSEMPATMVVGIAYGASEDDWRRGRNRDLTPVAVDWLEGESGGARQFLSFIAEELVPRIDRRYRTRSGDRTLCGASFAGLFTLYALFEEPELFRRYLAAVPTVGYGDRILFAMEEELAQVRTDVGARVFISAEGSGEEVSFLRYWSSIYDFAARLRGRGYPGLQLRTVVLEGESRASAQPRSFTAGLKYLFAGD